MIISASIHLYLHSFFIELKYISIMTKTHKDMVIYLFKGSSTRTKLSLKRWIQPWIGRVISRFSSINTILFALWWPLHNLMSLFTHDVSLCYVFKSPRKLMCAHEPTSPLDWMKFYVTFQIGSIPIGFCLWMTCPLRSS